MSLTKFGTGQLLPAEPVDLVPQHDAVCPECGAPCRCAADPEAPATAAP